LIGKFNVKITLSQLEAFFWVSQLGSVHLAARQLNLAQPTISLRIRDLEAALGKELFERTGRGIRPSEAGQKMITYASRVLDDIAQIRQQAGTSEVSGVLRFGVAEGFAVVCLAPLLNLLQREHPALRLELVIATSSSLEKDLLAHRLDLAVLVNPIGAGGLQLQPLGTQPTVWAASPTWHLGSKIRPSDVRHLPIVTNPPPSAMYRQINDWFATSGMGPARLDICTSVVLVAHLVASGVAIGLLPLKMIEADIAAGRIDVLASNPPVDDGRVYAAYWDGGLSPAVSAVLRSLRAVLSRMDYLAVTAM
jgi:DNA-binding transcriptional LysR family regulator